MAITGIAELIKKIASGKSSIILTNSISPGTVTAANANCGFQTLSFSSNTIGTTYPNALVTSENNNNSIINVCNLSNSAGSGRSSYLTRIYKIGSASLTTLGSALSHVTPNPFPLIYNEMGTTFNLPLIPIIQVTTSISGTAPAFTFTYTNQNNSVVSSDKTFTFPSATTLVNSVYFLPLNYGDYGAIDINTITITTTGTTGTVNIWLMEIVDNLFSYNQCAVPIDNVGGMGLNMKNKKIASTQSNNAVESYLISLGQGTAGSTNNLIQIGVEP